MRVGAFGCALLATTTLTAPAYAQSADLPPPTRYQTDENGVDLTRAAHILNITDIAIGPSGRGGLAYVRQLARSASRNGYDMGVFSINLDWTATFGLQTYAFTLSGGTYTSTDGSGATLTFSGGAYTLTLPDSTVVTYANTTAVFGDYLRRARVTAVAYPTGEQIGFAWVSTTYCSDNSAGCSTGAWVGGARLQSVSSSLGYQLHLNYGQATASSLADYTIWKRVDSISAINTTVDSCSPSAHSCTLTRSWPTVAYSGDNVTDPAGRTTRYTTTGTTYAIRRPSSSTDNVVYTYGTNGYISSVVRDGLTWGYNYSVSGSTATMVVTDPSSHTRTIVSNLAIGLPTSVTDELGHVTSYSYDSSGRLQRITAPESNYVEYSYDGRGNVTQVLSRDKAGNGANDIATHADYPTSCTNVLTCNQPTATRDALNNQTDYTYDSTHGGLLTVTAPAPTSGAVRPQTRYTYSSLTAPGGGSVYRVTAVSQCQTNSSCAGGADEVKATIAYSQANLLPSSVSSGSGDGALTATSSIGYDEVGRPITVDGPLSGSADTARTRYNAAGQVTGTTSPDPDGAGSLKPRAQRISYNSDGQVNRVEAGNVNSQSDSDWAGFTAFQTIDTSYDSSARPVRQTLTGSDAAVYAVTDLSYDAMSRPECTTQRMNPSAWGTLTAACTAQSAGSAGPDRIVRTTYDLASRPTRTETAYGVTGVAADEATVTYTDNGRIDTLTDANGNKTTYEYDYHDRLLNTRYPSPTSAGTSAPTSGTGADFEQLGYDADGNVTSRRLRDGTSIGFTYDALNRVIAKNLPASEPDVSYAYDLLNRMTGASFSGHSLTFSFDALGRNRTQAGPLGTASYAYDLAGRRTQLTYPGTGLYIDYVYDAAGEMTQVRENGATSGAGLLAVYAYDDQGRRTSLTRGNGTVTSYSYDPASRLSQLVQDLNGTASDITLGFSQNPASQIAAATRSNDSYAWAGHYAVNRNYSANGRNQYTASGPVTPTYDARGNLTSAGGTSYAYTSENMLSSASGQASLAYDPLGRLFQVSGASTTRMAYDGATLIAEYDSGNSLQRRYVFGPGTDEPLVWYDGSGTSTRRWFHADERGSVIAVSDASGNAYAINSYDEYGIPGAGNAGRFQYTGQMWMPELGIYHYRARAYSPSLGRFMQTDPVGYGGGMNIYGYVGNDPVNLTDPRGLDPPGRYEACIGSRLCVHAQNGGFGGTYPAVGASVSSMAGPNYEMRDVTSYYQGGQLIGQTYGPWVPVPGFVSGGASASGPTPELTLIGLNWFQRKGAELIYSANPQIRRNISTMLRGFGLNLTNSEIDQVLADLLLGPSTTIAGLRTFENVGAGSALSRQQLQIIGTYIGELPNTPLNQRIRAAWQNRFGS